jgi:hypothetical protein
MRYDLNYFIRKPKCPRRSLSFTNSLKKRHENKTTMELKDKVNLDLQAKRGSGHISKGIYLISCALRVSGIIFIGYAHD